MASFGTGLYSGGCMPFELAGSNGTGNCLLLDGARDRCAPSRRLSAINRSIAAAALAAATILAPSPAFAQTTGLVAAYALNEGSGTTVADSSGNNNNGTITAATWTTSGQFGNALVFNGTSARVTITNSASLGLTSGMSLEAWVFPTGSLTSWLALLCTPVDHYY